MNVLLTGGAGFIGHHLSAHFLAQGHRVTVVDNLSTGRRANLAPYLRHSNFNFIEGRAQDAIR